MNDGADIVGFDTFCGLRSSTFGCCSSREHVVSAGEEHDML